MTLTLQLALSGTIRFIEIDEQQRAVYSCSRKNFSSVWPHISAAGLKHRMLHSHPMRHNHCNFGRNRAARKGSLLLPRNTFQALYCVPLQRGDSSNTPGTPFPCGVSMQVWSKSGSNDFSLAAGTVFRPYLAPHSTGVAQTSKLALSGHAPQPL